MKYLLSRHHCNGRKKQKGVSLIVVLLLLVIVSMLGVASMQISLMGERGARNDRDMQVAWQGAEAALTDAQIGLRNASNPIDALAIDTGCSATVGTRGFCRPDPSAAKPVWQVVDFGDASGTAETAALGTYTGRTFANANGVANKGIQPAQAPRYIVEDLGSAASGQGQQVTSNYNGASFSSNFGHDYRITAMGFGPRSDIQAVAQTIFRH